MREEFEWKPYFRGTLQQIETISDTEYFSMQFDVVEVLVYFNTELKKYYYPKHALKESNVLKFNVVRTSRPPIR